MSESDVCCSICMDNIFNNEIYKTSCDHIFHRNCLLKWLEKKESCPYCRKECLLEKKNLENLTDYPKNFENSDYSYNLFYDHEFYYFYYGKLYTIRKIDINYIELHIDTDFLEKIDIIIIFIKNNYNINKTIIDINDINDII